MATEALPTSPNVVYDTSSTPRMPGQDYLKSRLRMRGDHLARNADNRPVLFVFGSGTTISVVQGVAGTISSAQQCLESLPEDHPAHGQPLDDLRNEIAQHGVGQATYKKLHDILRDCSDDGLDGLIQWTTLQAMTPEAQATYGVPTTPRLMRQPLQWCKNVVGNPTAWRVPAGLRSWAATIPSFGPDVSVITSNFDPLIEVALKQAGLECAPHTIGNTDIREYDPTGNQILVAHYNGIWSMGDAPGKKMRHSEYFVSQPRRVFEDSLTKKILKSEVIVVGYGGWNDCFMRALRAAAKKTCADDDLALRILWAHHAAESGFTDAERALSVELSDMGRLNDESRVLQYQGIDFDSLFTPAATGSTSGGSEVALAKAPSRVTTSVTDALTEADRPPSLAPTGAETVRVKDPPRNERATKINPHLRWATAREFLFDLGWDMRKDMVIMIPAFLPAGIIQHVYWPLRAEEPSLVHYAQAVIAHRLSQFGGTRVHCLLDDVGTIGAEERLHERLNLWMGALNTHFTMEMVRSDPKPAYRNRAEESAVGVALPSSTFAALDDLLKGQRQSQRWYANEVMTLGIAAQRSWWDELGAEEPSPPLPGVRGTRDLNHLYLNLPEGRVDGRAFHPSNELSLANSLRSWNAHNMEWSPLGFASWVFDLIIQLPSFCAGEEMEHKIYPGDEMTIRSWRDLHDYPDRGTALDWLASRAYANFTTAITLT